MVTQPPRSSGRSLILLMLLALLAAIGIFAFVAINGWPWSGRTTSRPVASRTEQQPTRSSGGSAGGGGRAPRHRSDPQRIVVTHDPSMTHGSFEGRVVSIETGAGVSDAELTFTHGQSAASVHTNELGHFVFLPSADGPHAIAAITARGYLPFAPALGQSSLSFVARAGERLRDVVLFLDPAHQIVAVVTDPEGRPVEGAEVRLIGEEGSEAGLASLQDRFVTDAAGEARFEASTGTGIETRKDGYARARSRIDDDERERGRIEITLTPGQDEAVGRERLAGRVLGPAGEPIEGASVRARARPNGPPDGPGGGGWRAPPGPPTTTVSDAEGRFELEGLQPGLTTLVASHPDFLPGREAVSVPATEPVAIRLEGGALLEGTVRARGGEPVAAFNVILMMTRGLERHTVARRTFLDSQGRFEMRGLRPGNFVVTVAASGYAQSEPRDVVIGEGAGARTSVQIELGRGGRVSGTVIAESNRQPVVGARVTVASSFDRDSERMPTSMLAVTDGEGRFELDGVTPGARSLDVRATGFHAFARSGVIVTEGGVTPSLEVVLRAQQEGESRGQELVGIGAILGAEGDRIMVRRVIEGGGAAEAGLVAGDSILRVDGVAVGDLGFEQTMERIRGTEGTTVTLSLLRQDGQSTNLVVRRRRVRI